MIVHAMYYQSGATFISKLRNSIIYSNIVDIQACQMVLNCEEIPEDKFVPLPHYQL